MTTWNLTYASDLPQHDKRREENPARIMWTCVYDPEGDFTGKKFPSLEAEEGIRHGAFARGAVLRHGSRKIVI